MQLIIGNKNYSSWSLRPWLLLKKFNIEFEEVRISLNAEDTDMQLKLYSDAGKVPVLRDGELTIWDSLAICEYVSEQYLDGKGWPTAIAKRVLARAASAEMHSSFHHLRRALPMNCRAQNRSIVTNEVLDNDIERVEQLWCEFRNRFNSTGWLTDEFSIVDCMFAPVVFRLNTYQIPVSATAKAYINFVLNDSAILEWTEAAEAETEIIPCEEIGT